MADTKTILLVDDDEDILEAMRAVLEKRGYRVVIAIDGTQGLAAATQELPDLVVVDMMMPSKSGFVVLDCLKNQPGGRIPAVIMITGNTGIRHRAYAEILGVDDYILKPFALDRLLESIQRL